jgi:fatty-acyl-CoA synthase
MPDTLAARIHALIDHSGDKIFLRAMASDRQTEELSYRATIDLALKYSALFDKFNVAHGQTVVLVLSDPKEVFLFAVGALLTGRVPIISAHPSAKLSVTDFARTLLPLIANARPALVIGDPEYCVVLSQAVGRRIASRNDLPQDEPQQTISVNTKPPLFIQYSSGTTGAKKGVCITEAQLLWQVDAYAREINLSPQDHIVSWLPLYHDMGLLTALMIPLLTGTTVTMMSPFEWIQRPMMLLETLSQDKGTLCWLPNFAYNLLARSSRKQDLSKLDLSSLRGVVNCSEPISQDSHDLFLEAFADRGFRRGALAVSYAMAETTFAITSGGFNQPLRTEHVNRAHMKVGQAVAPGSDALVSSGRALDGVTVVIFDDNGTELGEGHVGEIGVKSPSLMDGYFENVEATRQSRIGPYFMTGDLGFISDGEVFVTGRSKDLIITAGRNIYPQDIEAVVNDVSGTIPGRCVAFGIPDGQKGTESAVVIAESDSHCGPPAEKLAREIAQNVTSVFDIALADVFIVEPRWLQKSTSGKIARGRNRDRYLEERATINAKRRSKSGGPADSIRECIFKVCGKWVSDANAPLLTSGLIDSLGLTGLILEIENNLHVTLPMPGEVNYGTYDTIANIEVLLKTGRKAEIQPSAVISDRQVKVNYYLEGERNFEGLILGSSRSFALRAASAAKLGVKSFNFSGSNVNIEEIFCMLRFAFGSGGTNLQTIILGIDPTMFIGTWPLDLRFISVRQLIGYLEDTDQRGGGGLEWRDDSNFVNLKKEQLEKAMQMRYREFDVNATFDPATGDILNYGRRKSPDASHVKFDFKAFDPTQVLMMANQVANVHPRRIAYLYKIIDFCADHDIELHIYTNPLHPKVVALFREKTKYLEVQDQLVEATKQYGNLGASVHNTPVPSVFGGDDDDYQDGTHMTFENGDKLLEFILTN